MAANPSTGVKMVCSSSSATSYECTTTDCSSGCTTETVPVGYCVADGDDGYAIRNCYSLYLGNILRGNLCQVALQVALTNSAE